MSFRIRLSRKAALDIARNSYWLVENRSDTAALSWRDELEASLHKLETSATLCPEAPEAEWIGLDIREQLFGRRRNLYRILFRLRGETAEVLRVRHTRQDSLGPDDF